MIVGVWAARVGGCVRECVEGECCGVCVLLQSETTFGCVRLKALMVFNLTEPNVNDSLRLQG